METKIKMFDVTKQVGKALEKAGFGDDSNSETDIKKAGMFDVLDALSGKDNSKFSVEEAGAELKRRGL
ncbi:hypothetical protein CMI37_22355 [Candidatus Pacearchaeota archaeon]|nr:hypothetical protein [Candidatus Pacearchaeota archaeon]|tara:strand:+ start:2127 stop:2330 length:204 start_codon:yes stop_codon:yes gene_type:complete